MKDKETFIKNILACATAGNAEIDVTVANIKQDTFYHFPSKQKIIGYKDTATIDDLSHYGALKRKDMLEKLPMIENTENILNQAFGSKNLGGSNLDFDSRRESFPGLFRIIFIKSKLIEYAHKNGIFVGDIDDAFYFKDKQFYIKTVVGSYAAVNFSKVGGDKGNTFLLMYTLVELLKQRHLYESDGFVCVCLTNNELIAAVKENVSFFPKLNINENKIDFKWHKYTRNNLLNKKIPENIRPLIKYIYVSKTIGFKFGLRLPQA